jgi:hypothetical protein
MQRKSAPSGNNPNFRSKPLFGFYFFKTIFLVSVPPFSEIAFTTAVGWPFPVAFAIHSTFLTFARPGKNKVLKENNIPHIIPGEKIKL